MPFLECAQGLVRNIFNGKDISKKLTFCNSHIEGKHSEGSGWNSVLELNSILFSLTWLSIWKRSKRFLCRLNWFVSENCVVNLWCQYKNSSSHCRNAYKEACWWYILLNYLLPKISSSYLLWLLLVKVRALECRINASCQPRLLEKIVSKIGLHWFFWGSLDPPLWHLTKAHISRVWPITKMYIFVRSVWWILSFTNKNTAMLTICEGAWSGCRTKMWLNLRVALVR